MTFAKLQHLTSNWLDRPIKLSWTWKVTWAYLIFMLFLPLTAMFLKAGTVGWDKFWNIALSPEALSTYDVTFTTSLITAMINGVFGTAIAWVLVRYDFPGKRIIDASIDLPFALPTAVAGLTLASVYSDNGWIGSFLAPLGIHIAFTRSGVAMAMLFISLPFVVRTVQPVLMDMEADVEEAIMNHYPRRSPVAAPTNQNLIGYLEEAGTNEEEAARTLGANDWQVFWRVTLPNIRWGLMYGVFLTNARAMGEFGAVSVVSGNITMLPKVSPYM
jgi:sulfate/thiosulfate transport system permease protein